MLKTLLLPNIFVESVIDFIFQDSLMNRIENFCDIIHVFTATFDQFNARLITKSNNCFQKHNIY